MNTEDTVLYAQEQAEAARALLSNKTLQAAFEKLEQEYLKQWQITSALNVTALQEIKLRQDALTTFRNDLEAVTKGGRIAEFNNAVSRTATIGKKYK